VFCICAVTHHHIHHAKVSPSRQPLLFSMLMKHTCGSARSDNRRCSEWKPYFDFVQTSCRKSASIVLGDTGFYRTYPSKPLLCDIHKQSWSDRFPPFLLSPKRHALSSNLRLIPHEVDTFLTSLMNRSISCFHGHLHVNAHLVLEVKIFWYAIDWIFKH